MLSVVIPFLVDFRMPFQVIGVPLAVTAVPMFLCIGSPVGSGAMPAQGTKKHGVAFASSLRLDGQVMSLFTFSTHLAFIDIDWASTLPAAARILAIIALFFVLRAVGSALIFRSFSMLLRSKGQDEISDAGTAKRRNTLVALFSKVLAVVLGLLAILMILRELRFEIVPILASAGILGLAISFGAQNLVRDVLTGTFIIAEDQFGIGDVIKVGDIAGAVEDINIRTTKLRDVTGTVHIIPNGDITRVSVMTKDWSRFVMDVDVAYDTDLSHAIQITLDTLVKYHESHPDVVLEKPDVLGVENLGDSGITIRALIKTAPAKQWQTGRELRKLVKEAYDDAGIEIPFPQRTIWNRAEPAAVAPPKAAPKKTRATSSRAKTTTKKTGAKKA